MTIITIDHGFSEFRDSSGALIPPTLICPYTYLNLLQSPVIVIPSWLRFLKFTGHGDGGVTRTRFSIEQSFLHCSTHILSTIIVTRYLVYASIIPNSSTAIWSRRLTTRRYQQPSKLGVRTSLDLVNHTYQQSPIS